MILSFSDFYYILSKLEKILYVLSFKILCFNNYLFIFNYLIIEFKCILYLVYKN